MTLHRIHYEFPFISGNFFSFSLVCLGTDTPLNVTASEFSDICYTYWVIYEKPVTSGEAIHILKTTGRT
jgi:hypothetical protein